MAKTPRKDEPARSTLDAIRRYEGPLVRYASRLLGNVDRARDVVQDTFLRLCIKGVSVEDDHLAEWLFAVCRNRAVDILRKESRMSAMSDPPDLATAEGDGPGQTMQQREMYQLVSSALASLPVNQQEVLRLKFQEGFAYKQIAGITGLSLSNVGVLIHRAVSTLRGEFARQGLLETRIGKESQR